MEKFLMFSQTGLVDDVKLAELHEIEASMQRYCAQESWGQCFNVSIVQGVT